MANFVGSIAGEAYDAHEQEVQSEMGLDGVVAQYVTKKQENTMTRPVGDQGATIRWQHFTGIFLLSFATLLLELSLTRVLSVTNWYHFGFLVVSTALLGFGAARVTLSLSAKLRE